MSQDPIADTKTKLDDLEQRIHAAKSSLGARGELERRGAARNGRRWSTSTPTSAASSTRIPIIRPASPRVSRFDVDILRTLVRNVGGQGRAPIRQVSSSLLRSQGSVYRQKNTAADFSTTVSVPQKIDSVR